MKKAYFFLFAVAVAFLSACGPNPEEAAKYNDEIIKHQAEVVAKIDALSQSYTTFINDDIQAAYDDAFKTVNTSIETINGMETFSSSPEYKDQALELFNTYKSILENEHKEMVRLYALPDSAFTQEISIEWDKLAESSDEKTDEALEKFSVAQKKFAEENNLDLTGGE